MKINLNADTTLTLTTDGAHAYNVHYEQYPANVRPPRQVTGSVVNMPLWEVMSIFGPHLYSGGPSMFESNDINVLIGYR
jgi:hypothetical protein